MRPGFDLACFVPGVDRGQRLLDAMRQRLYARIPEPPLDDLV